MKTLKLDAINDYENAVNIASEILVSGGIVAVPTETVYGLAASAFSDDAIRSVFTAKGRPQDNPLIVHIASTSMLGDIAKDIPEVAYECAKAFWPGPFTMVLPKGDKIADSVSGGLQTVAVRFPSEKTICDIIIKSGLPLAAPSANTSGKPSPTSASHVIDDLDGKIDAVVIGGDCAVGVESTVVSLIGESPRLLRPGAVTPQQLRKVLPNLVIDDAVLEQLKDGQTAASPGMKYKHYAPRTNAILVEGCSNSFVKFVNEKTDCAAICFEEEYYNILVPKISYGSKRDEFTLAQKVFSVLRDIDDLGVKEVYIHAPSKDGVGLAVYNRLIRACGFNVVTL
ncbi:MAG: threonylcarbamoyl-AMP synthase [Ruminococcaceae bacterium]|nr:threonylcarbamoyl-AMP synthase [Oscillospiraceae bacterium]